jgi:hypothetical protein
MARSRWMASMTTLGRSRCIWCPTLSIRT